MTSIVHYFSPCVGTSQGHQSIMEAVRSCVAQHIESAYFKPCQSLSDSSLRAERGLLVVDFPDISSWPFISWFIKSHPCWRTVYLSMAADIAYVRGCQPNPDHMPRYSTVVALEPGAGRFTPSAKTEHRGVKVIGADHHIAALIRPFIKGSTGYPLAMGCAVYVTSGYCEEIDRMKVMAAEHERKFGVKAYTLDVIQRFENLSNRDAYIRPIGLLCDSRIHRIFAPAGYSTFWELHAAGLFHKVTWLATTRPVENIIGRISLATTRKSDTLNGSQSGLALMRNANYCERPDGLRQLAQILQSELEHTNRDTQTINSHTVEAPND